MPASTPYNSQGTQYVEETVVASAAKTASGNSSTLSGFGRAKTLRVQLDCTAVSSGTTLDVTVEDTLDGTNWNTIGTFTQLTTSAGRQVINITNPFADRIRIKWVIAGTSYTFSVVVASEADPS